MRVFLSYRRDDTAGRAGRLSDGLTDRLGTGNVFHDVGSIAPGVDFEAAILGALADTDATILVIGPDWATVKGPDHAPRLLQPDDYVRTEVAAALASGRPVVPVLVGDARLPTLDELPEDLTP
jgi:TIR domain